MLQAVGPGVQQHAGQQPETGPGVVIPADISTRRAQAPPQGEPVNAATEELKSAVRRELLRDQVDGPIAGDHLPPPVHIQAHLRDLGQSQGDVRTAPLLIPCTHIWCIIRCWRALGIVGVARIQTA